MRKLMALLVVGAVILGTVSTALAEGGRIDPFSTKKVKPFEGGIIDPFGLRSK